MALSKSEAELRKKKVYLIEDDAAQQIMACIPDNYTVIGPVRDKWVVKYADIKSSSELAVGLCSLEDRGSYELKENGDSRLANAKPMNSPKPFLHLPREVLLRASRDEQNNTVYETPPEELTRQAFFGIRPCDVNSIYVMDLIFNRQFNDQSYNNRRRENIIIALNCFEPGANCFCSTFDTGPALKTGFDLCLSSVDSGYLVEVGTDLGAKILAHADLKTADPDTRDQMKQQGAKARSSMPKAFNLEKAVKILNENYNHPYWEQPSERCLSCSNCINICPTCYCYQIEDKSNITLSESIRTRTWDACQNQEFAAVNSGNFRPDRADRLRQWVNHKINWTIEQYGQAGCVGCGRCITWCPTRIDITEPIWRIGGGSVKLES